MMIGATLIKNLHLSDSMCFASYSLFLVPSSPRRNGVPSNPFPWLKDFLFFIYDFHFHFSLISGFFFPRFFWRNMLQTSSLQGPLSLRHSRIFYEDFIASSFFETNAPVRTPKEVRTGRKN